MKNKKQYKSHYLSLSYKILITNKIVHYIFTFIEEYFILIQISEIYSNNFESIKLENTKKMSPLTIIALKAKNFPELINFIIYFLIILIILINYYILNKYRVKINIISKIALNFSELLFYRLFSLLLFDYLYMTTNVYLIINIIFTIIYVYILIIHFCRNNLYYFFLNLIVYPYDAFSKIIDIHLLFIKVFLSISSMTTKINISKFFFIISIIIIFVLLFYLSYIMLFKSYFLMNNISLNKIRYSTVLVLGISIIFAIIIEKEEIKNIYYQICFFNIYFISTLFICYFYDPYNYIKFDKDDNIENIFNYSFIFDRDKNKYLLLEEKLEDHISRCNKCNLCKKYGKVKNEITFKNEVIDLYYIISNGNHYIHNLFNNLMRGIKKKGKNNINSSYYLINLIYIYSLTFFKNNINLLLNIELLFDIVNSENTPFLEDYKICLDQIQYSNNFFIKANKILIAFDEVFDEKNLEKKSRKFLKLAELLNKLKYKEIKSCVNNNNYGNNNAERIPNCNNLITICSLFYEELFNESISNSGIYIKDSPNILEDLINNNYKNIKQITLEINIANLKGKIIRAGGYMNKYENNDLIDYFPSIFRGRQTLQMKKNLLDSNNNVLIKSGKKYDKNINKKNDKKIEKEYINFSFIIEEKENDNIFYRLLKLKLRLILLRNINMIIYLNGTYSLFQNIIVTEKRKEEEIVLHFGNKEHMNKYVTNGKNNIIIKKEKHSKFLCNTRLIEDSECFVGCKKYFVYHFALSDKKNNKGAYANIKGNLEEEDNCGNQDDKMNIEEKNEIFIFNDMASQTSSTTSTMSRNILIYNSKANKNNDNEKDITNKFNASKISLILILFIFFIFIIFQCIFLLKYQKLYDKLNNFNLLIISYSNNFETLFFSVLSLICIANSTNSYSCIHYMNEITKLALEVNQTNEEEISNKNNTINSDDEISSDNSNVYSSVYFINFTELLFSQNEILYNSLNNKLDDIIKYLSTFQEKEILSYLYSNISHYKINKKIEANYVSLYLTENNFTFFEFLLLMTSRFGIIIKDCNNLIYPIYILNKTGDGIFNNIYGKERLNSYQENLYLSILDYTNFRQYLSFIENNITDYINNLKKKFRNCIYAFININLIFFIIIIIILLGYLSIYLLIIYKILDDTHINLKEKLGSIQKRDILRKKIDNLKLLLKFYENDINVTLSELNSIYNNYRDSYNLKIKEEARLIKKEGINNLNENKNDKYNCLNLFKIFKKFQLQKYSKRKKKYFYGISFIVLLSLASYIITMIIWVLHFKKENIIREWIKISSEFVTSTNGFMNNFLLMFINNKTLEDFSSNLEQKDYITYIYTKLTYLYEGDKYFFLFNDIATLNDQTIEYDCWEFYHNIDNDYFNQLKNKFKSQEDKLYTTMYFFCEWSSVMTFKKYKTVYLQLFNQIKVLIENYTNDTYNNIIKFITENLIVKIEIIFLITYAYLINLIYENTEQLILTMMSRIEYNIIINIILFIVTLIIVVFILFFVYIKNVSNDCKKFINTKKVFKVCNINE